MLRKSVKHGIGRLTASAGELPRNWATNKSTVTRLTQISHKAPMRLIPINKTSLRKAGAAVCALSNYGAGMLQGDSAELSVHVEPGAKLGVITQGAARVYSQRAPGDGECKAKMDVTVEKDGILVYAPDPCIMFASSSYSQIQEFCIHPKSSVVLIDWISSGRFKNQERWEFDKLHVRTRLKWLDETETKERISENPAFSDEAIDSTENGTPFLQDSISIAVRPTRSDSNQIGHNDPYMVKDYNCFASLIIYGEHIELVKNKCKVLSDSVASQFTRVRKRNQKDQDHSKAEATIDIDDLNLASRVVMGFSKVSLPDAPSDAYVFRCAGKTNEDIYRVFHYCLKPLAPSFGFEFYKDRILAQQSEIPTEHKEDIIGEVTELARDSPTKIYPKMPPKSHANVQETSSSFWSIIMLADSGLPTGSFAHSAGLEAATQLGLIQNEEDLRSFVEAATTSSIQLLAPFLVTGLRIAQNDSHDRSCNNNLRDCWEKLNRECEAVMVTNQPACSASVDQGKSLVRVVSQWLSGAEESSLSTRANDTVLKLMNSGSPPHIAPALGVVGGLLGLTEIQVCRLFSYCMARDLVSSAVRLSLIGPLASVPLLHNVQESVEDAIHAVYHEIQNHSDDPLLVAATSAPVIEAVHPCHEILQVRLFRS